MKVIVDIQPEYFIKSARPTVEQVCGKSIILAGIHRDDKIGDLVSHLIDVVQASQIENLKRAAVKES